MSRHRPHTAPGAGPARSSPLLPAPEHVRVGRCREGKCARRPRPGEWRHRRRCRQDVAGLHRDPSPGHRRGESGAGRWWGRAGRAIGAGERAAARGCAPGSGRECRWQPRCVSGRVPAALWAVRGVGVPQAGQRSHSVKLFHRGVKNLFNFPSFKVCCHKPRLERFRSMWKFSAYNKVRR